MVDVAVVAFAGPMRLVVVVVMAVVAVLAGVVGQSHGHDIHKNHENSHRLGKLNSRVLVNHGTLCIRQDYGEQQKQPGQNNVTQLWGCYSTTSLQALISFEKS